MKNQYKLGNLNLNSRVFLAPMVGINDIAFRILCKQAGAGLVFSGMTHPLTKEKLDLWDKPILQIMCSETRGLKEFILKYNEQVSGFDLNLGCPADVAEKCGFGSFLISDLKKIREILSIIKENTDKVLTIKIRKSPYALKIARIAEKYCDSLIIHPRTQKQGYSGLADTKFAENIKKKIRIPVIYSGDVDSKNYLELLKTFDFVMIGRKAIGNPGIFSFGKKSFNFFDYLKLAKKHNLKFKQIKLQALFFIKDIKDAKKLRLEIAQTKKLEDLERLI